MKTVAAVLRLLLENKRELIRRLFCIPLLLFINGCYMFSSMMTLDDAKRNLSQTNYSDGIDKREAIIIAQHYLFTTEEEPCRSAAAALDIGSPYTCGGWREGEKSSGRYVCFDWKGWRMFSNPMFVKVNSQTGEAKCFGQHVVK